MLDALAREVHPHAAITRLHYDCEVIKAEIFDILTSVLLSVLLGLCGAGLRVRKAHDEEMYAWLVKDLHKSKQRPSIHVLEFTDQVGRAPTLDDMELILGYIGSYLNANPSAQDSEAVLRIDKAGGHALSPDEETDRLLAPDDTNRHFLQSGAS